MRRKRESKRRLYVADDLRGDPVYLSHAERTTHTHVIGASGEGKSRLLEHMILADAAEGRGVCVIDPHGTLCRRLLPQMAARRVKPEHLHLLQPGRPGWTFGFDPLAFGNQSRSQRDFGIKAVMAATAYAWGARDLLATPRLRTNLKLLYGALVDLGLTLPDAGHFLVSNDFDGKRAALIRNIRDPRLRQNWEQIASMRPPQFNEFFESTRSRLNDFIHSPVISEMLRQKEASIDTRALMDEGGVLLVDLSDYGGHFAEDDAQLLGTLLVNDLVLKAFQRPEGSPIFNVYIDECGRYLSPGIERILFEGRKFGLHLTLAHQDLSQLGPRDSTMYGAIMSGAQTKICFRLGRMRDAREIAEERMSSEIDYQRVKAKLTRWETVDHEIVILRGASDGRGRSETEGFATSDTDSEVFTDTWTITTTETQGGSQSVGEGETLDADGELRAQATSSAEMESWTIGTSVAEGQASARGSSHSTTSSSSSTRSEQHTDSRNEALKPVLRQTATQAYSIDEQQHAQAHEIYSLDKRHALILRRPHKGELKIDRVKTPYVPDGHPGRGQRLAERFEARSLETSPHAIEIEEADVTESGSRIDDPGHQEEPPSW